MIKINLVGERKVAKAKKATKVKFEASAAAKHGLLAGILVLGFVIAGAWWYAKNREMEQWKQKREEAQQELVRLEEVRKKGEYYKQQKERLERQIQLVTDLKKKQAVPVHILDQVSKNLPDFLWLHSMTAQSNSISLQGKATTYNAVSNFYNNLTESGFFADVVLGRTSEGADGVAFSLMCRFLPATPADEQQEAQQVQG